MGTASATFSARQARARAVIRTALEPHFGLPLWQRAEKLSLVLVWVAFQNASLRGGQLLGKRTSSMIAVTSAFGGGKPDTAQARHGFPVLTPSRHNRTEIPQCGKSPATPTAILSANDGVDDTRSGIGVP